MSEIFIAVLNMSLTASYVAVAVILARLLLRKAPKIFSYALWAVVLFRMICPFSFESVLSLLPANPEPIPQDIVTQTVPRIDSGIRFVDTVVNRTIQNVVPPVQPETVASISPMQIVVTVGACIWLSGIVILIAYAIISYIRTKRRIFDATLVRDNIFQTDRIQTPFVIGFVRPKIYIPVGLDEKETDYIIMHERTHIRRGDHLIKVLSFTALAVHWFNPLMWVSYFLMSKDMEMSCDERVMKLSGEDIRTKYSQSLLSLSVKQSGLPNPLAFGESNVKTRVRNVLRYKKPAFWISIVSVIAVMSMTVTLAFNQREAETLSAREALDELKSSIEYANGELSFIIPANYPTPSDWIIWTSGHLAFDDGFSMSWHFYEGDTISEARGWEAGRRYVIIDDKTESFENFDSLGMDIYLPDENGNDIELEIDLMPYLNFYTEDENRIAKNQGGAEELFFYGYGVDVHTPDFLTEQQQNLYKMAVSLYHASLSPDVLDMERFFPLKEGQEYIAPNEGEWVPDFITDDGSMYAKTIGRYRKWEDFQRLITSVFTLEAFDELNEHNTFIEIDGDLYILGATGMPYFGYSPKIQADTFNLISSSENEIKFTVTGYFYDSEDNYVSEITTHEIILTKTTSGWRFSKFDVVWM